MHDMVVLIIVDWSNETIKPYTFQNILNLEAVFLFWKGQYHPYLDIYEKVFQLATLEQMSRASGASILRFQELSINYDSYNVYVSATILGRTPFLSKFSFVFDGY
jgi:hypothetical protein